MTIADRLETICRGQDRKTLIYWKFESDDAATQDIEKMLRALIRQLSAETTDFPEAVTNLVSRHRKRGSSPDGEELMPVLQELLKTLKKDVFLVLDALDEYHEDVKDTKRQDLFETIQQLVKDMAIFIRL